MSSFEKDLLSIIEERVAVLSEIDTVLFSEKYQLSQEHFGIFSVQSITMMYAIWEGFVQESFQLYIAELNKQNVKLNDFCGNIIVFHMENKFKQLRQYPKNENKKVRLYSELQSFYSQEYHSLYPNVNTESNVGFDTLNRLLKTFCLEPFSENWKQYERPQPTLKDNLRNFLRYRNSIAHGSDVSSEEKISREVYTRYRFLISDLMYGIHEKMMDGLDNKTYLKA